MNWITNYVRPRINSIFSRRETPDNLWTKCTECGTMLFHREVSDNLNVCTSCNHHMAITPRDRFEALFDGGVFTEVDVPMPIADPLQFRDQKKYPDRMKAAQKATGEDDAMLVARGEIGRTPHHRGSAGLLLYGRVYGDVCGQRDHCGGRRSGKAEAPVDPVFGRRRCAHARRHFEPDADATHHSRYTNAQRSKTALHCGAHASNHGGRDPRATQCSGMCTLPNPTR